MCPAFEFNHLGWKNLTTTDLQLQGLLEEAFRILGLA